MKVNFRCGKLGIFLATSCIRRNSHGLVVSRLRALQISGSHFYFQQNQRRLLLLGVNNIVIHPKSYFSSLVATNYRPVSPRIPGTRRGSLSASTAVETNEIDTMGHPSVKMLAKAWTPELLVKTRETDKSDLQKPPHEHVSSCRVAVQRTLPLFLEGENDQASVPFVCRYRTDLVHPLTTQQVHELQEMVLRYKGLKGLREKLLQHYSDGSTIRDRILTSISKSELEDYYAPFKPPPKGSILEKIRSEHPKLFDAIEDLWTNSSADDGSKTIERWSKLGPRTAIVQVLGSKISSDAQVIAWVLEELKQHCRVKTSCVQKPKKEATTAQHPNKYSETYGNFSGHNKYLKDYQVLAIRRGVEEKALKLSFDIDSSKMESHLLWRLRNKNGSNDTADIVIPAGLLAPKHSRLLKDAIHDAWTRLLRRKGTSRLWTEKCKTAQDRACQVFEENLHRALLAPPHTPTMPLLALDPGFAAGIKCAVLDFDGSVRALDTIKFLGSDAKRKVAIAKLQELLGMVKDSMTKEPNGKRIMKAPLLVALGNGHGSADCRKLVEEASALSSIPLDVQLVNEAGASVWSVTESAHAEFPDHPPAAIAAISIGRRLQNPLFELVKVPPKSLGLGMYQHDLSAKELDEKLHRTSVDAVAMVGVDVNSASLEILQKIPGLTQSLAKKIIRARPIHRRKDLLAIDGLGPKSFENCAGFVRVSNGPVPLDNTFVHPESYTLAKYLLKEFKWDLDAPESERIIQTLPSRDRWESTWETKILRAATKHDVSKDRVLSVLENLVDSMSKKDPRIQNPKAANESGDGSRSSSIGNVESCRPLSAELSDAKKLSDAMGESGVPMRGIVGTVRNIADFGAFVDIGNENDGLLHLSMLGPNLQLKDLLIGQQIGVDVLSISSDKSRISLGVHGCNFQPRKTKPFDSTSRSSGSRGRGSVASSRTETQKRTSGSKRLLSTTPRKHGQSKKKRRVKG